jgi:hypothetical protein
MESEDFDPAKIARTFYQDAHQAAIEFRDKFWESRGDDSERPSQITPSELGKKVNARYCDLNPEQQQAVLDAFATTSDIKLPVAIESSNKGFIAIDPKNEAHFTMIFEEGNPLLPTVRVSIDTSHCDTAPKETTQMSQTSGTSDKHSDKDSDGSEWPGIFFPPFE